MRGWRTLVICLLHVLPFGEVGAELFHRRRDHLDQAKYEAPSNKNVVKDRMDAEFVLSKYGYLRCHVSSRRKRDTSLVNMPGRRDFRDIMADLGMPEEGGGEICDETEVQKAIREYQRTYNLPATGQLDKRTKDLMSTSRCGNKDGEKDTPVQEDVILNRVDTNRNSKENVEVDSEDNKSTSHNGKRLWKRSTRRLAANSKILKVLTGDVSHPPPRGRGREAHLKYLEEYVSRLRESSKGKKIFLHKYTSRERRKRSIQISWAKKQDVPLGKYMGQNGELFNKKVVRWRLLNSGYSNRIPVEDQRATIDLAFRMWSEVIPLKFKEDTNSDINDVDIEIAFGKGHHQNCDHDFDGNGGEIAHSWNVGNVHFDDQENFKSLRSYSPDGIYLLRVAVHEIGHVLGLVHTNKTHSIMYAIYHGTQLAPEFELSWDDRKEMQNIYGVCRGKFNTLFDWVRRRPDNQFIYNTYFFRDNHYWLYENHANRTRYGDPLYIAREWDGVPNDVDGYVHVWVFNGASVLDDAYFFKGQLYYKYDSEKDRVVEGWPRRISDDFGPKPGGHESIPNNIDSVFFDPRNKYLYFFKNDDVYVYNPIAPPEEKGCCVRKAKIVEEFPAEEGSSPLPSNLDSVYYSYRDKMMYFLKSDSLWKNRDFDPRQRRVHNRIQHMGSWYQKWIDICDVAVTDRDL